MPEETLKLGTLTKALQLIELLSLNPRGLPLSDMSSRLGFPKSTVHHMLQTFLVKDYVSQDIETRKYSLGLKFLQVSSRILEGFDLRDRARKHLVALQDKSHEVVHLYVIKNARLICIDKVGGAAGGLSISSFVGWTTDPHPAAAGKVLLSDLTNEEILKIYPSGSLKRYGKNTITDLDELFKELEMVRKQGYAIDDEEYYEGVRCIAAPVKAGGRIVASVSITGSIFSMTMKKIGQDLTGLVKKTANTISKELINAHL
ncbi:MAG: IclR family transcriptional regulator [Deltaproteobacteria bacterium]|nr:IclR family transcriptional regulator [Deltaproteobacteria bacterium]